MQVVVMPDKTEVEFPNPETGKTSEQVLKELASVPRLDADAKLAEIRREPLLNELVRLRREIAQVPELQEHIRELENLTASITERAASLEKSRLCQCELSGEIHVLMDGKGCELCESKDEVTPENVEKALRFYQQRVEKTASAASKECEKLRAIKHAFRHVDDHDWSYLFTRLLDDSGNGKFWKAVMTELSRELGKD